MIDAIGRVISVGNAVAIPVCCHRPGDGAWTDRRRGRDFFFFGGTGRNGKRSCHQNCQMCVSHISLLEIAAEPGQPPHRS